MCVTGFPANPLDWQELALTGQSGLLKPSTKTVLESAPEKEIGEHLGRDKHEKASNTRNGTIPKTVITDAVGPSRNQSADMTVL